MTWFKNERRLELASEYPQVKSFAQGRTIIEKNSTTKALRKQIYSVKRMRQRSEKYKANNIKSYLIES